MKHHRPRAFGPRDLAKLLGSGRHLLRILSTTDLHMNLDGYDYSADRPSLPIGLNRLGPLIDAARNEAVEMEGTALVFDNGDALQGTPMADVMAHQRHTPHPLMQSFTHLGYSALGLGNHDFNFGIATLSHILEQAPCPVIVSNLHWLDAEPPTTWCDHLIQNYDIPFAGESKPLKIGVIGLIPTEVMVWDSHLVRGQIEVDNMVDSARSWVMRLKDAGCDVIIALAHAGLGVPVQQEPAVDILKELAAIDGVDALVGGHTHKRLPGIDHSGVDSVDVRNGSILGVPAVMAGHSGAYLGQIDLVLDGTGSGWRTESYQSALIEVSPRNSPPSREDPKLREILAPARRLARQELAAPVGMLSRHIHGYFGSFSYDPSLELIAKANANALAGLVEDTQWADLPILAAISPQGSSFETGGRGYADIPAGPVSLRHLSDIYTFPDILNAVIVTGEQLTEWLEHSAGIFEQIVPGKQRQRLLKPSVPPYEFDVVFGLEYRINPAQPARYAPSGRMISRGNHRIKDLRYRETPVDPTDVFLVALSSYRANGASNIKGLCAAERVPLPPMLIFDSVTNYLRHPGQRRLDIMPNATYPWQFTNMPNTSVFVETGQDALLHLDDILGLTVRSVRSDEPSQRILLTLDMPQ